MAADTRGPAAVSDAELGGLIRTIDDATDAYIRGDLDTYLALFDHADDFTLMVPYGGPTVHGFTYTEEAAAETKRFFATGEGRFELQQTYVAGGMAVVVGIERQHGEVGGTADQDWSLRVTLVFRRRGERWELAHRHADPLVREIPWDRFAEIAGGIEA